MRRSTTALLLAGALAATAGLTACGTESASSPAMAPVAAVKAAGAATSAAGTARISVVMTSTVGGKSVPITLGGPIALDGSKADLSATLSGSLLGSKSGDLTLHEIVVGSSVYLRFAGSSMLPDQWFKVDGAQALAKAGLGSLGAGSSVGDTLATLNSLGDVREVGHETVHDVATTHYRATLDAAKLAPLVKALGAPGDASRALGDASVPVDVWIDGSGRLVRLTEEFTATVHATKVSEKVAVDLSDFGVPVTVTAPAGALDMSSLLGG